MATQEEPQGQPPERVDDASATPEGAKRATSPNQPPPHSSEEFRDLREIIVSAERAESQRFSLWSLLALMTLAAVVLGLGTYLPKAVFAGVLGIATLVAMVLLSLLRLPAAILQIGWWMLLVIYLIAIASAIRG